ncbi:protein FAM186A [Sceloporus undulatus]|uniref:protein FAM186A n=1 Tax=Sceloporus undulatus TaxID=8520 RepID=UPI001C4CD70D|nr:protein FAM186A [Sceloporus undulatus]
MDVFKLAWENLPSPVPKKDDAELSASSKSGSESEGESESDIDAKPKAPIMKPEITISSVIEIPPSVKNVLEKLEVSQLERAKKEIAKKLCRIVDNVNHTYERYRKDEGTDPEIEREYQQSQSWEERSRRSHFLNKVSEVLEDSVLKVQDLQMVLESCKGWYDMLKTIDWKEMETPTDRMVEDLEKRLLNFINSIETNIHHLIKIFHPLLDGKDKSRRKSAPRPGMFKAWREKMVEKPHDVEPLTPQQMMEDEALTLVRCHEVNNMIQEIIDSTLFSKVEALGIKYIEAMMTSLTKAFSHLSKQCRSLKIKCESLAILETRKQDPQIGSLQRELKMALEKKAALEIQVQNVEERCKVLLITNEMMQRELQDANERALVGTKVIFPRAPPAKAPTKSPSDTQKAVVKSQPDAEKAVTTQTEAAKEMKSKPDAEKEEKSKMDEKPFTEVPSGLPQKKQSVTFQDKDIFFSIPEVETRSLEKLQVVVPEEEQKEALTLLEEILPPSEPSFTPLEESLIPLEARPQVSRISLDGTAEEAAVIQMLPEAETAQTLLEVPLTEAHPDREPSSEEPPQAPSKEKAVGVSTSTEDEQSFETEVLPKEKEHVHSGRLKAAQMAKRTSKLGQWKKLQTSLLKKPIKSQEGLPTAPPEESAPPTIPDKVSEMKPSPKTLEDGGAHKMEAEEESIKGSSPEAVPPVSSRQPEEEVSPTPLEDDGSPKPETEEESVKGSSPEVEPPVLSKESEGEVLPKPLEDKSTPKPETEEESIKGSAPGVEPPELPKPQAEASAPITSPEVTRGKRKTSLRISAGKVVTTVKVKRLVKVMGDSMTQKPATAPDSPEKGGIDSLDISQPISSEGVEDSATETQEAVQVLVPKRWLGKTKEAREKRETKRTGRVLADVPHPKQEEKTEELIHGLSTKLQEVANERGGVIDVETIKEIFAEMGITDRGAYPGQVSGSHSADKQSKSSAAKKSSLPVPGAEQASKKEKRSASVEESPSGADASSLLQEFQAAILASLEHKLEKAKASLEDKPEKGKKGSLSSHKHSVRFQPTDPLSQQLFQVIERKLEECFLLKQRSHTGRGRPKSLRSTHSKGELGDEEEKEIKVITPSFESHSALDLLPSPSSFSLSQTEREKPMPHEDSSHLKAWPYQEEEGEQVTKGQEELPSGKKSSFPCLPMVEEEKEDSLDKISSPREEEHLPEERDVQRKESWEEGLEEGRKGPSEEQLRHTWGRKEPERKESKAERGRRGSQEIDDHKGDWYIQLQEQLQREKEQLQEEQGRLQEERQRLEEEETYLKQWQEMFEEQRKQWEAQEEQRQEQERLWQVQLQHWHHLQQENEEREQHWARQQEQHKEQHMLLEEEVARMKQEYEEYLKMRGQQAEEVWHWNQLKAWHEERQQFWQQEDEERERKQAQWQEQLTRHREEMETLQQEREEKERELKKWQQTQQEWHGELERLWEKRWEQQLQRWHHQMRKQRAQQLKWQEQSRKLMERQHVVQRVQSLAPKMKVVEGSILDQFAKRYKVSPVPRERRLSTTPQITPIPSREFEEDSWELETTWFPKLFSKAEEFPAPGVTEKRYWINVEAQRRNLELLREAVQRSGISTDLYIKADAIIHQVLYSNVERLALLFRKYASFSHLQQAR